MAVELVYIARTKLTYHLLSGIRSFAHLIFINALRVLIQHEGCRG